MNSYPMPTSLGGKRSWMGMWRFLNAPAIMPEKVEYLKFAEEAKINYQVDEFIVVNVDVDLDVAVTGPGDKALEPLVVGTNRKRARSMGCEPHQPLSLPLSLQRTHLAENTKPCYWARGNSEEPEEERPAKKRRLIGLPDDPPTTPALAVEHDESEMSGSSPGKRKRGQYSDDTKDSNGGGVDQMNGEIADSADEGIIAVDVEEVLHAKRVPRSASKKVDEAASSDLNVADIPEGNLNALATKPTNEQKKGAASAAKYWEEQIKARYNNSKSNPETAASKYAPSTPIARTVQANQGKMGRIPGGVQPVNRLSNQSAPRIRNKVFDLKNNSSHNDEQRPSKKLRSDGSFRQNYTPSELNEAEGSDKTVTHNRGDHSAARSGSLHSAGNRKDTGTRGEYPRVDEYNGVENQVKAKRNRARNSEVSETLMMNGNGSDRYKNGPNQHAISSWKHHSIDNTEDPIVDSDTDGDYKVAILKKKATPGGKTFAVVELPGKNSDSHGGKNKKSTIKSAEATESRYFTSDQTRRKTDNSVSSSRVKSNPRQPAKAGTRRRSLIDMDPDTSLDHLSDDRNLARKLLQEGKDSKKLAVKGNGDSAAQAPIDVDDSSDEDELNRGDIKPAHFTSSKKSKTPTKAHDEYTVRQAVSETNKWKLESKEVWVLRHNTTMETLHLIDSDAEEVQLFSFTARNIRHVELSYSSSIIALFKSKDANSSTKILMQLGGVDECTRFAEKLQKIDSTVKLIYKDDDYLEKCLTYFAAKEPPTPKRKQSPTKEQTFGQSSSSSAMPSQAPNKKSTILKTDLSVDESQELSVLMSRSRSRADSQKGLEEPRDRMRAINAKQKKLDDNVEELRPQRIARMKSDEGLNSERSTRRNGNQQHNQRPIQPARSQGLAKGMSSSPDFLKGESIRRNSISEVAPKLFYGKGGQDRISPEPLHETRSSTRQQHIKELSLSSERWSQQNSGWKSSWKASIIYPTDPKLRNKATVDKQDIERLDEGQFLNDNLINFYLLWLEQHHPQLKARVYFHNSFFYQRLTSSDKGKGGFHYESVERWTAKVDLLNYDYIIIPVNENYHWYLAIICNAPNLSQEKKNIDGVQIGRGPANNEVDSGIPGSSPIPGSAQQSPRTPSDVDTKMEKMSLETKTTEPNSPKSWPSDNLELAVPNGIVPLMTDGENEDDDLVMHDGPTQIGSDLLPAKTKKTSPAKQTSKRVASAGKYDASKPRIITLDSLGSTHSPTCSNLKKYLVREFETKKQQKIAEPGSIGVTARGIPTQDNSCDCGLYLLGYAELFLKDPDEFVRRIVQREGIKEELNAPKMRTDIREILFNIQKDQAANAAEAERQKLEKKAKSKRAAKPEKTDSTTQIPNSAFQDVSKGVSTSPEDDTLKESSPASAKSQEPAVDDEQRQAPQSDSSAPQQKISSDLALDGHETKVMKSKGWIPTIHEKFNSILGLVEPQSPKLKPVKEVIQIDDSPEKPNYEMASSNQPRLPRKTNSELSSRKDKDNSVQEIKPLDENSNPPRAVTPSPDVHSNRNLETRPSWDRNVETPQNENSTSSRVLADPTEEVVFVPSNNRTHEIEDSQTSDPDLLGNDDCLDPPLLSSPRSSRSAPTSPSLNRNKSQNLNMDPKGNMSPKRKHTEIEVAVTGASKRRRSSSLMAPRATPNKTQRQNLDTRGNISSKRKNVEEDVEVIGSSKRHPSSPPRVSRSTMPLNVSARDPSDKHFLKGNNRF